MASRPTRADPRAPGIGLGWFPDSSGVGANPKNVGRVTALGLSRFTWHSDTSHRVCFHVWVHTKLQTEGFNFQLKSSSHFQHFNQHLIPPSIMPASRSPNALWASWVQEAADKIISTYAGKEVNSYKLAANAIRAHPVPMIHPSEALSIKYVGQKTIGIITQRLMQDCEETGEDYPEQREHLPAEDG